MREPWIAKRGYATIEGRGREARGQQRPRSLAPRSGLPGASARCGAAPTARLVTQYEFARAGIVTEEMIYVAHRENLGRQAVLDARRGDARRGRELRRRYPALHHAGIRACRGGARTRHHPGEHQPSRDRADGDRPQFPGEDQRQYRQFRRHLLGRRGGREDGLGDALGRRHGHGPLDRAQHPQYPRLDHPEFRGADRHGADLPGAREGRRRSAQARLGGVQGHADRAGRAGRRLLHDPCRRAPRPCAADGEARHRHRLARRLDHGALVPRGPSRELPLRALRRDLRHHAPLRRLLLARRRPAPGLDRGRQRRRPVRRARDAWASSPRSPGRKAAR